MDGSVALDVIHADTDHIDAVLLDFTIPGKSSREVFQEILRVRPGVKVIVTSAYNLETVAASFIDLHVEHFIRKPFGVNDFVRTLMSALSGEDQRR